MSPEPEHCQHTVSDPYFEFYKKIKKKIEGRAVGQEGTGCRLNKAHVRTGVLDKEPYPPHPSQKRPHASSTGFIYKTE